MSDNSRNERFERLVRACGADLYRYAVWLCGQQALARDLLQETYLRAWKSLDSLKEEAAAKRWLITILRREFARTFERKVPPLTSLDDLELPAGEADEPSRLMERDQLRQGIAALPRRYREPLMLQVLMGYSCAEIARELGLGTSAVMTRLFRAREQLKASLGAEGEIGATDETD